MTAVKTLPDSAQLRGAEGAVAASCPRHHPRPHPPTTARLISTQLAAHLPPAHTERATTPPARPRLRANDDVSSRRPLSRRRMPVAAHALAHAQLRRQHACAQLHMHVHAAVRAWQPAERSNLCVSVHAFTRVQQFVHDNTHMHTHELFAHCLYV